MAFQRSLEKGSQKSGAGAGTQSEFTIGIAAAQALALPNKRSRRVIGLAPPLGRAERRRGRLRRPSNNSAMSVIGIGTRCDWLTGTYPHPPINAVTSSPREIEDQDRSGASEEDK